MHDPSAINTKITVLTRIFAFLIAAQGMYIMCDLTSSLVRKMIEAMASMTAGGAASYSQMMKSVATAGKITSAPMEGVKFLTATSSGVHAQRQEKKEDELTGEEEMKQENKSENK